MASRVSNTSRLRVLLSVALQRCTDRRTDVSRHAPGTRYCTDALQQGGFQPQHIPFGSSFPRLARLGHTCNYCMDNTGGLSNTLRGVPAAPEALRIRRVEIRSSASSPAICFGSFCLSGFGYELDDGKLTDVAYLFRPRSLPLLWLHRVNVSAALQHARRLHADILDPLFEALPRSSIWEGSGMTPEGVESTLKYEVYFHEYREWADFFAALRCIVGPCADALVEVDLVPRLSPDPWTASVSLKRAAPKDSYVEVRHKMGHHVNLLLWRHMRTRPIRIASSARAKFDEMEIRLRRQEDTD